MKTMLALLTLVLIVCISGCSQNNSPGSGRFIAVQPPSGGDSNFVWVLDTKTGEIKAYRYYKSVDKNGDIKYWGVEQLQN